MADGGQGRETIFGDVHFSIMPHVDVALAAQARDALLQNGGTEVPLPEVEDLHKNLSRLTHVIATTAEFPAYLDLRKAFIAVVSPRWVLLCVAANKTVNPRPYNPDARMFFHNTTVLFEGLPPEDEQALKTLVMGVGGSCVAKLTRSVTHVVARNADGPVAQSVAARGMNCKIVLDNWIEDCIALKRIVSEYDYIFPDPPVLQRWRENSAPMNTPDSLDEPNVATLQPPKLPAVLAKQLDVFKGLRLFFSSDLQMRKRLQDVLVRTVEHGGGEVVSSLDDADALICQYRDSSDYAQAHSAGIRIGNLSWFHFTATFNNLTQPTENLLHYPKPCDGIPGFANTRICITLYQGEQRLYLEDLVHAAGGVFTKTLTPDNTHLIAASTRGEKCEATTHWTDIALVNHIWLEQSYARNKLLPTKEAAYKEFPALNQVGTLVGQTVFSDDTTAYQDADNSEEAMDVDTNEPTSRPKSPIAVLQTSTRKVKSSNSAPKRSTDVSTPLRHSEGKENETPIPVGSRSAKLNAYNQIKLATTDMVQYEKEKKRKGGVTHGKPKESEIVRPRKRSPSHDDSESDEEDIDAERKTKRGRPANKLPPIKERLIVTMYDKWLAKPQTMVADRTKLRNLGIQITKNPTECSILCAPRVVKTPKFLAAIAMAPAVVSTEWLDACLKTSQIAEIGEFLLENDKKSSGIQEAIRLADHNSGKLLDGWQIFCTADVPGGFQTFELVVSANGGRCNLYNGQHINVSKRQALHDPQQDQATAESLRDDDSDRMYLLSVNTPKHKPLWNKFTDVAHRASMTPMVVKPEWMLEVVLKQSIVDPDKWAIDVE